MKNNKKQTKKLIIGVIGTIILILVGCVLVQEYKDYKEKEAYNQEIEEYNSEMSRLQKIYDEEKTETLQAIEDVVYATTLMYVDADYSYEYVLEEKGLNTVVDIQKYCSNAQDYLEEHYLNSELWDVKYVHLCYALNSISKGCLAYVYNTIIYGGFDNIPYEHAQKTKGCFEDAKEYMECYSSAIAYKDYQY